MATKKNVLHRELEAIAEIVTGAGADSVIALFAGEPDSGKTIAAIELASRLGIPILRVDASDVMPKYIGETKKNLETLIEAAQSAGAVLFFDEADALFGKRSNTKDAGDRYANLDASYLLQHLEGFLGLVVLATNSVENFDPAFLRSVRHVIQFPLK